MQWHGRCGSGGVTLVELMVVLAIAVVLLTLTIPSLSAMLDSMRLSALANTIFTDLQLARSEAAKRNARVILCKSTTGDACITSGGWEQGWMVFVDTNNNAVRDAGEVVLTYQTALPRDFLLYGNSSVASYVSYTPTGTANFTSGAFQAGTLTMCRRSPTPVKARQVVISSAGRPRTGTLIVNQCPSSA